MASTTRSGRWTRDEHSLYIEGVKLYGKNWSLVAKLIGTRTALQNMSALEPVLHLLARHPPSPTNCRPNRRLSVPGASVAHGKIS
mmetsp:Transcript_1807/g.3928  ORF Transcript_1807/g.3928 Transcript_1807/m.3928 type:complete len:85 (-) Transcript_1807:2498-2752(-)